MGMIYKRGKVFWIKYLLWRQADSRQSYVSPAKRHHTLSVPEPSQGTVPRLPVP